jgi:hypothetical protein
MKTYVSYVIQDEKGHRHESEILTTQSPSYSYSKDPQTDDVIKWTDEKRKELKNNENLVITGIFKL